MLERSVIERLTGEISCLVVEEKKGLLESL